MKPFHQAACQTQNFKSHFVSNIIFKLGLWWGEKYQGLQRGRSKALYEVVGSVRRLLFQRWTQSSIKIKKSTGFEMRFCNSWHTRLHACVFVNMSKIPRLVPSEWMNGWGSVSGLDLNSGTKKEKQRGLSLISRLLLLYVTVMYLLFYHHVKRHHLHKLIKPPSRC